MLGRAIAGLMSMLGMGRRKARGSYTKAAHSSVMDNIHVTEARGLPERDRRQYVPGDFEHVNRAARRRARKVYGLGAVPTPSMRPWVSALPKKKRREYRRLGLMTHEQIQILRSTPAGSIR